MSYVNILVEKKEGIGIIKINRPNNLNALNKDTIVELTKAVEDLEKDKNIKVAILTGEGKAFIAGADIKQMKDMDPSEAKKFAEMGHNLLINIEKSRLPFIAAVNGYALGGGCEVMMACDICIAAASAKIGQPEINLGIHPGFGGTQRLPRLVGRMKAKELLLTGDSIDANEAYRIGLVNIVVPDDKVMEEAEKLASKIAGKSAVQTSFIKSLVNKGMDVDFEKACSMEIYYFSRSFETEDQKEGMSAFLEKRKPVFKGK
ncbi:MAG: enoyl-CoA hydratase-related protein [Candidatus Thermoplasmatota archaeon]|jgi:enoyl-CoA hydratase|nr:enoyl-CoA hydratase-related protein [Candidatus Thermoplasmatota archaeon]